MNRKLHRSPGHLLTSCYAFTVKRLHSWLMYSISFVVASTTAHKAQAQRELWGYYDGLGITNASGDRGGFWRMNLATHAYTYLPVFDTITYGILPTYLADGPMVASNNKIYGAASGPDDAGVLYCYDLTTDSAYVVAQFGTGAYPAFYPGLRMTEAAGNLFGATAPYPDGTIYRFDIATEELTLCVELSNWTMPGVPSLNAIASPFMLATDGLLYTTRNNGSGLNASRVVRHNPANCAYQPSTYTEAFDFAQGTNHFGNFIEQGDYLYSVAGIGGDSEFTNWGVVYRYNKVDGTYEKLLNFSAAFNNPESGMVDGGQGLFYGVARYVGNALIEDATLYAYDPVANALTSVVHLADPQYSAVRGVPRFNLLAASNGSIFGTYEFGVFEYVPALDSMFLRIPISRVNADGSVEGHGSGTKMMEICRKPNYKPHSTTSFNVCAGAHFFYDLQNVNATTVVWRRNGTVVLSQTSELLEFPAITEADEGVWTCTLTNECGVTEPPAITITVNTGAFSTSSISGDTLLCGTGDGAFLSGNSGGTWAGPVGSAVNGATTPNAIADVPGLYHVWNTQACGISLSNAIDVVHLDSAQAPVLRYQFATSGTVNICPYQLPITFSGNDGGPWGNYPTGAWPDGSSGASYSVIDTGFVYLVGSNSCNSDTSGIFHMAFVPAPPSPQVAITDQPFGNAVDTYLCAGESLYLNSTQPDSYPLYLDGQFVAGLGGGSFAQPYLVNASGTYQVLTVACTPVDTLTIVVYADTLPPSYAAIYPNQELLTGCEQDTVLLTSSLFPCYWNSNGNGGSINDTSITVQVDWSATQYILTPFNGCGNGPQDGISIQSIPAPDVSYDESDGTICLNGGTITLALGVPAGGTYSGPGVSGNNFDPVAAGLGEHTITYSYDDGTCTGYAQDVVLVDICNGIAPFPSGERIGVRVFPNPNNGSFAIQLSGAFRYAQATLFNSLGQEMMSAVPLYNRITTIHKDDLPVGVHALRIAVDGRTHIVRLVVTR